MKALRSFPVSAALPPALGGLMDIAMNLRWSWDGRTRAIFRSVDAEAWERAGHEPVRALGLTSRRRLEELASDPAFLERLAEVTGDLSAYLREPRWYQAQAATSLLTGVAYFSPEFGVGEGLPVYSGGLGVLAGDHLKAASDLGVPLVGVGLLYREGYFRQRLSADGWQQEHYPALDPHDMPLELLADDRGERLLVSVDLAGVRCVAQIWRARVGRVDLLLLDSDVEENDPPERTVTDRLYGGDREHRLRQEILLGIGGVRALDASRYEAQVFHSNEGHAGFLGLERIRRLVADEGLRFAEALEVVRSSTIFTTHTPVPAGIDVYERDLVARYFSSFAKECDLDLEDLMTLGRSERPSGEPSPVDPGTGAESDPGTGAATTFNMAVMGLKLAGRCNGVSRLHGDVSRSLFARVWPRIPEEDVPIGSITNGVHAPTWVGREMNEILESRLGPAWAQRAEPSWDAIADVGDDELWAARRRARERLVSFVRRRVHAQLLARGSTALELGWTNDVLDPDALTIGFARRFALYKRGTLLLSDPDRLRALLLSPERPVQIVIAGKAHPLDEGGKQMIQTLDHFARDAPMRLRFVFVEDYDMEVARVLCQGSDVWLNNPRRPSEASGTSGMKAAMNGAINCSTLDGWWAECYDGSNGWAIGTGAVYDDQDYQDRVEASALYDVLEREVVPLFYDRDDEGIPRVWIERLKRSMAGLGGYVGAERMVRRYVESLYEPAARDATAVRADGYAAAKDLAAWKDRVARAWNRVRVVQVDGDPKPGALGEGREIVAVVDLGELSSEDVSVELAHGRVGAQDELIDPTVVEMRPDPGAERPYRYRASFTTEAAGLYGFAVRVLPSHPRLVSKMDLGLIAWA